MAMSLPPPTHVILFYKYTPLSPSPPTMTTYAALHRDLATSLGLKGRLLIGSSATEGLNGTFSGVETSLLAYIASLILPLNFDLTLPTLTALFTTHGLPPSSLKTLSTHLPALQTFYAGLRRYHEAEPFPHFTLDYNAFKWSLNTTRPLAEIFPDCYIKVSPPSTLATLFPSLPPRHLLGHRPTSQSPNGRFRFPICRKASHPRYLLSKK